MDRYVIEYLLGFVICKYLKLILDKLRKGIYWKNINLLTESVGKLEKQAE